MMPQQPPFRWALLLLAFMITLVALVFASPEKTVELNTFGRIRGQYGARYSHKAGR